MTSLVEDYSSVDHMIAIRAAKERCEGATRVLFDVVRRAREEGALTWAEIAEALGVSRQSAQERFGKR